MAKREPGEMRELPSEVRDARELPASLRAKVETVRERVAGFRDLAAGFERAQAHVAALGSKLAKARCATRDAILEAEDEFVAYLVTGEDANALHPARFGMALASLGIDARTGESSR